MTREKALKIANAALERGQYLSWGVDGHGVKHYDCRHCGKFFWPVDPETIEHECPEMGGRKAV